MIFVRSSSSSLAWPQNGVVMSMQPRPWPDVPELTARMARASSPRGNLAMRIREELGEVYADARFAAAFGVRGLAGDLPGPADDGQRAAVLGESHGQAGC